MKKQMTKKFIAGRSGNVTTQPSRQKVAMYVRSTVEDCAVGTVEGSLVRPSRKGGLTAPMRNANSAGDGHAAFGGCNANNGNASASTLNSNNALSNGNGNYAGAFAANQEENEKHVPARPTRSNTTEEGVATGGHLCGEYDIPPFCLDMAEEIRRMTAESGTDSDSIGENPDPIWAELSKASSKRKIKNFKRFFTNPVIIHAGVMRCIERAASSKALDWLMANRQEVELSILRQLSDETYRCQQPMKRKLEKAHHDDKDRWTEIYRIYDRCVQNVMLIVLSPKLTKLLPRTCYSGIKGRSLYSGNKTYCMINQIRSCCIRHPNAWAGLTDIRHFYDTLSSNVVLGVVFKTVVCRYTRALLADLLLLHPTLTIGGTLSQILAMLVLADIDAEIKRKYKPQFFGSFGDNRIIIDDNKEKVTEAVHFMISYVSGRYRMEIKDDWQIVPVSSGFRFCKHDFRGSFVHVRSTMRRRALRSYRRGRQHFAGYYGILKKTDSKKLTDTIVHGKNSMGMSVRKMIGTPVKIDKLVGKLIKIVDWEKIENMKPSQYYIKFQCMAKDEKGNCSLNVCSNGSHEIKEYFKLVEEGKATTDEPLRVLADGRVYYFEGYHTTEEEALAILREQYDF